MGGIEDISDEDDDDDMSPKKKKPTKPPISLELQRLFYQLQTGAESNHQNEFQINKLEQMTLNDDDDDSDCSIFTLKSDSEFANGNSQKNKSSNNKKVRKKKKTKKQQNDGSDDDDIDILMDNEENMDNDDRFDSFWQSTYDKAVSTQQLIKSFGWSGSDSFVQHDVQEFLRVLMDKIDEKVKGTSAEKIVEKL